MKYRCYYVFITSIKIMKIKYANLCIYLSTCFHSMKRRRGKVIFLVVQWQCFFSQSNPIYLVNTFTQQSNKQTNKNKQKQTKHIHKHQQLSCIKFWRYESVHVYVWEYYTNSHTSSHPIAHTLTQTNKQTKNKTLTNTSNFLVYYTL